MGNKLELQIFPTAQADMEQIFEYIAFELKNPSAAVGQITDFQNASVMVARVQISSSAPD
mgnify:CR=1 FL=1